MGQNSSRWLAPPKLSLRRGLSIVLAAALFYTGVHLRPIVLEPYCTPTAHQPCTTDSIPWFDRISVRWEDPDADRLSNYGQIAAGAALLLVPPAWSLGRVALGHSSFPIALTAIVQDFAIALETVGWNGALNEAARLLSGRPRPFVYARPEQAGANPAHYVSFYSGHTSFAAACSLALLLILAARGAPWLLQALTGIALYWVVFITAYGRIAAGRHFLSDVLIGATCGAGVALIVRLLANRSPHRLKIFRT